MNTAFFKNLFSLSLTNPREAAAHILSLGIDRAVLWQALIAFAAVSAILNGLSMQVFPPPAGYPSIVTMPLLNFAVIAGGAMLLVHILTWTGRSMGGAGTVESVLTILVWLQAIWLVFDIISFVLILAAPGLALIFVMATAFVSFWIFLNFLSAAHQFDTLWRAFTVLFVSIVGLILGLAVLAALAGVDASGVPANV